MKSLGQLTLTRLSNNDKKFFEWCLENESSLVAIQAADIFKSKGVKVILNFTPDGTLNEIVEGERRLWRREKVVDKVIGKM